MQHLKVLMFKLYGLSLMIFLIFNSAFAKDVSLAALGKKSDVSADVSREQVLILNGFRQVVTSELEDLKLDSTLFWSQLDKKKLGTKDEFSFLKTFFTNEVITITPEVIKDSLIINGNFSGKIDLDKLKLAYNEVILDLGETKFKTFYIYSNIELDKSMNWDELGIVNSAHFTDVILDSWKKLVEKEISGFERVVILEKDFLNKPEQMNSKSVILKWKSVIKKNMVNAETQMANYELSAQYVLQNSKLGASLASFDFPIQKRSFDEKNKKSLSSNLASLVYNLLFSQTTKIRDVLEADAKTQEISELEISIISKSGLSEIYQINNALQEKYKEIKLTSQMKSYSSSGSIIKVRAEGTREQILEILSKDGGKLPLNEQKVLLFNQADKTFAILPKESNN
jgi:hypothetical protein